MTLGDALEHSRIFEYRGVRYFSMVYLKKKYRDLEAFTVHCSEYPMPAKSYEFSSDVHVKPVIRLGG